jgi:hypothetical protein
MKSIFEVPDVGFSIGGTRQEIAELILRTEKLYHIFIAKSGVDQKQTEELKAELLAEIRNEHKEALADIESRVREQMPHTILTKAIELWFEQLVGRLSNETQALKNRSHLNLIIGIGTKLIGLVALGFITFTITTSVATSQSNLKDVGAMILTSYLPKLSLVMLIELFAYFFLKLYKSDLSEIKYFQNELTNVEMRYAAVRLAAAGDA